MDRLTFPPGERGLQLEIAIRKNLPTLVSNNTIIQQGVLSSQNSAAIGAIQHFLQSYLTDNSTELAKGLTSLVLMVIPLST